MRTEIKQLTISDAANSAQLHQQGMPDDFLPCFGRKFLVQLHRLIITSPDTISLGFFSGHQLKGVIIGTPNTSSAMKQVMRRGFFMLMPLIFMKVITNPQLLGKLLQTVAYGDTQAGVPAELIVLSIDKSMQRQGAGTKLMQALKKEFHSRGIKKFRVGTRNNNEGANAFYVRCGGVFAYPKKVYGRIWNYYLYSL